MRYYEAYVHSRNPEPLEFGEYYYAFDYGTAASVFVLDTVRYGVNVRSSARA